MFVYPTRATPFSIIAVPHRLRNSVNAAVGNYVSVDTRAGLCRATPWRTSTSTICRRCAAMCSRT